MDLDKISQSRQRSGVNRKLGTLAAVVCFAAWLGTPATMRADNIDHELLRQVPKILEHLEDRGYQNVGVLSFMLKKGNDPSNFDGGLICDQMAERLASALILKHSPGGRELRVVRNAAAVAGKKIPGASYRTASDRQRLFGIKYALDWGPEITPDIFLAGKVTLSSDLRKTNVAIGAFEKNDPRAVYDLLEFDVPTDRQILADAGEGFSLSKTRRRFVRGFSDDDILDSINAERAPIGDVRFGDESGLPTSGIGGFPVTLELLYDGVEQPQTPDTTAAGLHNFTAPDPQEGQLVTFGLRNETNQTLAVVLTVNGISTLCEEMGPANTLQKWVLEPGKYHVVKGYHREDRRTYAKIAGLSEEMSQEAYEDLGGAKTAGMIHLYVFRPVNADTGSAPTFTESVGRLSPTDPAADSVGSFSDLRDLLMTRSELTPHGVRGLATYSLEDGDEVLKKKSLGAVELTDTMIVRYYSRPDSSDR